MCLSLYACVCVFLCVRLCIYASVDITIPMYLHMLHVSLCANISSVSLQLVCMSVCICMYLWAFLGICLCVFLHVCMDLCLQIPLFLCMYLCAMCLSMWLCNLSVCPHMCQGSTFLLFLPWKKSPVLFSLFPFLFFSWEIHSLTLSSSGKPGTYLVLPKEQNRRI